MRQSLAHQAQSRHATGPISAGIRPPPEGRHVSSGHIRARLAPVLYRSSFVVVVSGQWCTHCDTRDDYRRLVVVAIKTAFDRLMKSGELRG